MQRTMRKVINDLRYAKFCQSGDNINELTTNSKLVNPFHQEQWSFYLLLRRFISSTWTLFASNLVDILDDSNCYVTLNLIRKVISGKR
jgi:hypothetical protein